MRGADYLALAAESKTVSKKLHIGRAAERLKSKLPQSGFLTEYRVYF